MDKELQRFITLIGKQGGSDKVSKFIQYLCRFIAYYQLQQGNEELAKKAAKLMGAISSARKAPRLGVNFLKEMNTTNKLLAKKSTSDVWQDNLALTACICNSYYWYNDNTVFLAKAGVIERDTAYHGKQGNRGWFFAVICNTIIHLMKMFKLYQKEEKLRSGSAEHDKVVKDIATMRLTLVQDACNVICAFNFSKFTDYRVNEGVLSILGMTSAMITLQKLY